MLGLERIPTQTLSSVLVLLASMIYMEQLGGRLVSVFPLTLAAIVIIVLSLAGMHALHVVKEHAAVLLKAIHTQTSLWVRTASIADSSSSGALKCNIPTTGGAGSTSQARLLLSAASGGKQQHAPGDPPPQPHAGHV